MFFLASIRAVIFESLSSNSNRSSIYPSVLFSESKFVGTYEIQSNSSENSSLHCGVALVSWTLEQQNSGRESINLVIQTKQRELLTSKQLSSIPSSFSPLLCTPQSLALLYTLVICKQLVSQLFYQLHTSNNGYTTTQKKSLGLHKNVHAIEPKKRFSVIKKK